MAEPNDAAFDPYHRWLGIPKQYRPPTHYQLLGLAPNENDREVIEEAAIRQSTHLRTYQIGPHADLCTKLLNEVGRARQVLLNPQKRAEYDRTLASQGGAAIAPLAASVAVAAAPVEDNPFAMDDPAPAPPTKSAGRKTSRNSDTIRKSDAGPAKSKALIGLVGAGFALLLAIVVGAVWLSQPVARNHHDVAVVAPVVEKKDRIKVEAPRPVAEVPPATPPDAVKPPVDPTPAKPPRAAPAKPKPQPRPAPAKSPDDPPPDVVAKKVDPDPVPPKMASIKEPRPQDPPAKNLPPKGPPAKGPPPPILEMFNSDAGIFRAHVGGSITAMRLIDNGKRIYTAGADGTVCQWDLGSGEKLWCYKFGAPIVAFELSPDFRYLAAYDRKRIRIVGLNPPRREIGNFPSESGPAWLENGRVLRIFDGSDISHDLNTSAQSASRLPTAAPRFGHGTNNQIVTSATEIYVVDRSLTASRPYKLDIPLATCAALLPNEAGVVVGCSDKVVRKYVAENTLLTTAHTEYLGLNVAPTVVAVAPSGRLIAACGSDKIVLLWDAETQYVVGRCTQVSPVVAIAFGPNERQISMACADGIVRVSNVPREKGK